MTYLIRLRCNNCNAVTASALWTIHHSPEWSRSMTPAPCCSDRPNPCTTVEVIPRSERKDTDPPSIWNNLVFNGYQ